MVPVASLAHRTLPRATGPASTNTSCGSVPTPVWVAMNLGRAKCGIRNSVVHGCSLAAVYRRKESGRRRAGTRLERGPCDCAPPAAEGVPCAPPLNCRRSCRAISPAPARWRTHPRQVRVTQVESVRHRGGDRASLAHGHRLWTVAHIGGRRLRPQRLLLFLAAVIGLSYIILTIVFRSILVPLEAAALNLLSIGAACGVLVAVFRRG
jgi:hypothetical protein